MPQRYAQLTAVYDTKIDNDFVVEMEKLRDMFCLVVS